MCQFAFGHEGLVLATVAVVWRGWGGLLRAVFRPLSVFVQGL